MKVEEGFNSSLIAAAHELKTPLCLVRQLTIELENTNDENRKIEIIRRIKLTTERSLKLTDNLTKMARLEDALFEMEPIQLTGLINEVVDELSPLSKALKQNFNIEVGKRPLIAVGHRELLRSLMMGLIDNAMKYNQVNKNIDVSARIHRGETVIAVRDYGSIMDLRQYRQLANTLGKNATPISARPLSSGLGLLIADRFVRAMNGHLSMSRHHSGGVTFMAHLPISSQLNLLEI